MLERVIDVVFLLGLAALVIGSQVGRGLLLAAAARPARWRRSRCAVGRRRRSAACGARPGLVLAPERADRITGIAGSVAQGVAALRGGADFARVAGLTLLLWGVASVIPFWAALAALGIDLGGFARLAARRAADPGLRGRGGGAAGGPGFFGPTTPLAASRSLPSGYPRARARPRDAATPSSG